MIIRALRATTRYLTAIGNLGTTSTLKLVLYRLLRHRLQTDAKLLTKKFGPIYWNTGRDNVIAHLYTPQVRIYCPDDNLCINTIVDLGANIGIETIRFAKMYPQASIFSVEAATENYRTLLLNTNGNPNCTCVHGTIWHKATPLTLTKHTLDSQTWRVQETENSSDANTQGITFSEIMEKYNIKEVDILKVDIEGAEKQLFSESCKQWIGNVKCIIVESPDGDTPMTTIQMFKQFDEANYLFNTYIHGENLVLVRADLNWKPCSIEQYQ